MHRRAHIIVVLWVLLAAALLVGAGLLQKPLDRMAEQAGLIAPGNVVVQSNPKTIFLTVAPGGLRAPMVAYLWMRAEDLKRKGKYYDARQLAETICDLQPQFVGAWSFLAWNMAYNISVGTHTPEHRWLWVYNGVKLLRDKGIPQNPKALPLYRELAWTMYHKMGTTSDEMHLAYKQRWAAMMQHLLAPPPYGSTQEAIDAFKPIAAAPINKDPRIQGRDAVQQDQLALVLADANVAAYARLLEAQGVRIDGSLLDAYNRYSKDDAIAAVRPYAAPPIPSADGGGEPNQAARIAALINGPQYAPARGKLLAFVRSQILWNEYRMDPQWMLMLMEKYGPLDWRLVWPHAIYWATYGFHAVEGTKLDTIKEFHGLNTSRIILYSLKDLCWGGRMTYIEDPNNPEAPTIRYFADPRFVQPCQDEHVADVERATKERTEVKQENLYRAGHINFMINAIEMLYALYHHEEAARLLQYIRDTYGMHGGEWDLDVENFIIARLNNEGNPIRAVAMGQISSAIKMAYIHRMRDDEKGYRRSIEYAFRVYRAHQKDATAPNRLPPFDVINGDEVAFLLARPRAVGYNLSLLDRVSLYRTLDDKTRRQVYDLVSVDLRRQCQAAGLRFQDAFPEPPGMDDYRKSQQR